MYPQQPQYPPTQPPHPDGTHPPQHVYPPAPQTFVQQPVYPPAPPPQPFAQPAPQPQYGQPQYPPAPQTYAPQGYPPQGYPPQQYGQPPFPPPVAGTLDAFYAQPSTGGGKSLSFEAPGTQYVGIVTRPIGNGDIQQLTDPVTGRPVTFKDGRPKFAMKVPLQIQPSPAYPDGLAQWYVKGNARDELVRAMAEAGAPEGPPEAGAVISILMTGTRPSGSGMNPTKLFQVHYRRPQGAAPVAQPAAPPVPQPTAPPMPQPTATPAAQTGYQPAPEPIYATNSNVANTTNGQGAITLTAPAVHEAVRVNGGQPPQYVTPPPPPPPPPPPAMVELSPEQQQLLAQLTGAPAPAQ